LQQVRRLLQVRQTQAQPLGGSLRGCALWAPVAQPEQAAGEPEHVGEPGHPHPGPLAPLLGPGLELPAHRTTPSSWPGPCRCVMSGWEPTVLEAISSASAKVVAARCPRTAALRRSPPTQITSPSL